MARISQSGSERRNVPRTRRSFAVPYRLYDERGSAPTASGTAWLHDLGLKGLRLAFTDALPAAISKKSGSALPIECRLTAQPRTEAWLRGQTVWSRQPNGNRADGGAPGWLGVAFEPSPAIGAVVEQVLCLSPVPAGPTHEQLSALLEISHLLTSSLDRDHLLHQILDTSTRLLRAEGSSLLLMDQATGELVFQMPFGPGSDRLKTTRLKPGQGIAGWVVKERRPLCVHNVRTDIRFFPQIDALTGFKTTSILAAPLLDRDRVLGVIEVLNSRAPDGFDRGDVELLSAFAAHASVALRNAELVTSLTEEKAYYQDALEERYRTLIGESPAIRDVVRTARKAAGTTATVLLLGESGVGKEILARSIHAWSPRNGKPFRAVNCAALSDQLLESELFGHEKGSFTGAQQQKKGLFELAHGGTVFLDEIGEMRADLQAKLLRVLQDHEFVRVGGTQSIKVDIRIIAATNQDLAAAVRARRFRKDLFYRLNVVTLTIPPLRERTEDIVPLANLFLVRYCKAMMLPPKKFAPETIEVLKRHAWPGNVRELENAVERAVVLTSDSTIGPSEMAFDATACESTSDDASADVPFHASIESHKRAVIEQAIRQAGGSKTRAALALKLQPTYFSRLCKQFGIARSRGTPGKNSGE